MPEPDPAPRRATEDTSIDARGDVTAAVPRALFENFYRHTAPQLLRFLVMQGAPVTDAAEIAQDTLSHAYTRWHDLDNPRAWSFRTAGRAWIRRALSSREDLTPDPAPPSPLLRTTPTDAWHLRQELIVALAALPPPQRQVMAWTLSGYAPAEIATELQLPCDQVRANLRLARRALAIRLTDGEDAE